MFLYFQLSLLAIVHVTLSLEHPPPTYQQSEPSYVFQQPSGINLNQQYTTSSYVQPQIQQNIAHPGQEVIYSEYPQTQNVQYIADNQGQVYTENSPLKQAVDNTPKYATFSYPHPQNLLQFTGPDPTHTGTKNAPSNGYKVREIQSEDQSNPGSFLQSDDAEYFTSGFGHPFHFADPGVSQQQQQQPQGLAHQPQYQNTYNVFTDSVQNPADTGLNAYRPPQQVFMNSGL